MIKQTLVCNGNDAMFGKHDEICEMFEENVRENQCCEAEKGMLGLRGYKLIKIP